MSTKDIDVKEVQGIVKETVMALLKTNESGLKDHMRVSKAAAEDIMNKTAAAQAGPNPQDERGKTAARILRALAAGKGDVDKAIAFAKKSWGENDVAIKALAAGDATGGGFLVPAEYSTDLIELLRPVNVVRRMNPTVLPLPKGNLSVPKITGGASAEYVGENQNISTTQLTTGQVKLSAKKLAALVPISNDLIRFSSPQADTVVRDDLIAAMANRQDLAFIRGNGTGNGPRGLRYWANAANIVPVNSTVNLANVTTDLSNCIGKLEDNNVRMLRCGWLFHPRTKRYLMSVRDGNGNFAFRDEMMRGTLWTFPYATTTQIPTNLGGGGNESEIYFGDFADVVIGDAEQLVIDTSGEAAYHDGSNVVAAFSLDQTVVRAIHEHDLVLRHDRSVSILTEVDWI